MSVKNGMVLLTKNLIFQHYLTVFQKCMFKKSLIFLFISFFFIPLGKSQLMSLAGHFSDHKLIPVHYPELYYEIQIARLDKIYNLNLFYDKTVQEYIDLFLTDRIEDYIIFRERSRVYFPMLEKYLKEYNLPAEIKYMAVLESGLSPTAISPSLAVGMWQFKEKTGSHFGLQINSSIDERTDPELSTIAACRYLKHLYKQFNSWELSMLAYNAGPTTLSNAINQNKGKSDYYSLVNHLPRPAQRYLPAFIALIYLFENYENHF
jgi:membrane-bound lytic murein transglycosylase D